MHTIIRTILRSGGLLLAVAALLALGTLGVGAAPAPARRAAPLAAPLPATTCPLVSGTRTCGLWARTGTATLTGAVTAPIWGYADTAAGAATLPGPVLIVNQGEPVDIILNNVNLPNATSLAFPGQNKAPDASGVTAGNSRTYSFSATDLRPGTYLYQAGLTTSPTSNGQVQVAMGLFGALIVRPSSGPGTAYGAASSAYDDEAVVVVSEIDPALNAAPATFNMRNYAPKYWLINGKAYPDTVPIDTSAGNRVLLRYINAGSLNHSLGLLGLHQTVLATDGQPLAYSYRVVAETIPAGATLDTIATIPATAPVGAQFALYNAGDHLDNNGTLSGGAVVFGGMLAFLTVGGAPVGGDGPLTSNVAVSPNPTNAASVSLSATISDATTGGSNVTAAEYFVDAVGANGSGTPITGFAPGVSVSVGTSVSTASLTSGNHTFYVHGQDAGGAWGPASSAVLNFDATGPATSGLSLTPNPTNGTANVTIQATGNDVATGGSNVNAAEYFIDPVGTPATGTGTAMTLNNGGSTPTASLNATITAAVVNALPEGNHTIAIRSRDALGNWGGLSNVTLKLDRTGPAAASLSVIPNPNNGTLTYDINKFALKLSATFNDPIAGGINSNVVAAEGFVDTVGANGSGYVFIANDGTFNNPSEGAYMEIPLSAISGLTQGPHTLYVHGRDAAGNWGNAALGSVVLIVDRTGPSVTGAGAAANPSNGAASVTLTATATDPANTGPTGTAPASNIVAAEWFDGPDPGVGNGTAMAAADSTFNSSSEGLTASINVGTLSFGTHNLSLRAKDAAGNWGSVATVLLNVTSADSIFADGFELGNFSAWNGGTSGTGLSVNATGVMVGTQAMQVAINSNASRYVQDNSPTAQTGYRARFYFNPNNIASGTGQQHDIFVALNNSAQTVFRVQYRRNSASGNQPQVRAAVSRSGGTTTTNWFTITNNAANSIEVSWQSASSATFRLYTNGTLRQTLTGLNTNNSTLRVETVRLGPQVGAAPPSGQGTTPGGTTLSGVNGTEYFDAFVSRSNSNALIGP